MRKVTFYLNNYGSRWINLINGKRETITLKTKAMKVINDCQTLRNFDAWSGAVNTKNTILEHDKEEDFERLIDELYPDGITDTQLNDILWFDSDWVFECLGIKEEEEED